MRCDCKVLNLCPTALSLKWQVSCCGRAGPGIGLLYSADCSLLWATAAGSGWLRLLRLLAQAAQTTAANIFIATLHPAQARDSRNLIRNTARLLKSRNFSCRQHEAILLRSSSSQSNEANCHHNCSSLPLWPPLSRYKLGLPMTACNSWAILTDSKAIMSNSFEKKERFRS